MEHVPRKREHIISISDVARRLHEKLVNLSFNAWENSFSYFRISLYIFFSFGAFNVSYINIFIYIFFGNLAPHATEIRALSQSSACVETPTCAKSVSRSYLVSRRDTWTCPNDGLVTTMMMTFRFRSFWWNRRKTREVWDWSVGVQLFDGWTGFCK